MKIRELFEQTVAPVPPGQSGPLPTTQPTEGPPKTSNTPTDPNAPKDDQSNAPQGQQPTADVNLIKSNLDSLKPTIKAANGGVDFDSTVLAKALAGQNSNASVNPQTAKAMQAIMPALGAVEKSGAASNTMKSTLNTAAAGQMKQQQAQQKAPTAP